MFMLELGLNLREFVAVTETTNNEQSSINSLQSHVKARNVSFLTLPVLFKGTGNCDVLSRGLQVSSYDPGQCYKLKKTNKH